MESLETLTSGSDSNCADHSSGTYSSGTNDGDNVQRQACWHCSQTGTVAEPEGCCLHPVGSSAMFQSQRTAVETPNA